MIKSLAAMLLLAASCSALAWADGIEFWGHAQPSYKEVPLYVR